MDQNQLESLNTIYSTCAQIWAGLLVFHVLLVREKKNQISQELHGLWSVGREFLVNLIQVAKDPSGPVYGKLEQYGLKVYEVVSSEASMNNFMKVVRATREHSIATAHKIQGKLDLGARVITHEDYQQILNSFADAIDLAENSKKDERKPFVIGMSILGVNLLSLFCTNYFSSEVWSYNCLLLITTLANSGVFFVFGNIVYKEFK